MELVANYEVRMNLKVVSRTHVGNVREINEDSILYTVNKKNHFLSLVADGMGGHNAGEVASAIAKQVVEREFLNAEYGDIQKFLARTIKLANEEIYTLSLTNEEYSKMGTTLSILIIVGDIIYIGHIGDSRIYYFSIKSDKIYPITTDHTVVQMLYEQGHIKKEELDKHPYRNILAQSLGTSQKISADISELRIPYGGYILLCSDGLSDEMTDIEVLQVLKLNIDVEQKADVILKTVLQRTAKDNVSFILIER